jgi:hypothetical protein
VKAPWSSVEDLHAPGHGLFVAGDAAVIETAPGTVTVFGGPAPASLAISGRLVGADAGQLYFARPGADGEQLWREPLSGGTPTLATPSGTVAPWNGASYDPRSPLCFTANAVLTVCRSLEPNAR